LLGHARLANTLVYLHLSNAGLHDAIKEVQH
jgi:site-specific recombinase XerD